MNVRCLIRSPLGQSLRFCTRPLVRLMLGLIERCRSRCDFPRCAECADHFTRLASVYRKVGDYERALDRIEIAIDAEPKQGEAYLQRTLIYMDRRQYELALADIKRDLKLRPENAETHYVYGNALRGIGQRHQALRA